MLDPIVAFVILLILCVASVAFVGHMARLEREGRLERRGGARIRRLVDVQQIQDRTLRA